MKQYSIITTLATTLAAACTMVSCTSLEPQPAPPPLTKYEKFVDSEQDYPKSKRYYEDPELIKKATSKSPIYICLDQQRGRMYVDGQVAADWPVSTGVASHPTPTGHFRILHKKQDHVSATYGKIYDAEGKCIVYDADSRKDTVPEGGKFVGSGMPNWMRMTSDGVGMHTGKVIPGRRLSHGCIRLPNTVARKLFDITAVGTPVTVTQQPETIYPANQVLADKAKRKAEAEARKKAEAAARKQQPASLTPTQRQPELYARPQRNA